MTTIKFSKSGELKVLTFDGNVLELFYKSFDSNIRIHITLLDTIELKTDKKGKHSVVIETSDDETSFSVDDNEVPAVTNLIAEIERAKSTI